MPDVGKYLTPLKIIDMTQLRKEIQIYSQHYGVYNFYPAVAEHDKTNKVKYICYCNNGLSYAILKDNTFALVSGPIVSSIVNSIVSIHETFEELVNAFYVEKEKRN